MGGISIWQLLIVLGIVLLLFGTKRLRNLGGDLGGAIKGFKKAMGEEDNSHSRREPDQLTSSRQGPAADHPDKAKDKQQS